MGQCQKEIKQDFLILHVKHAVLEQQFFISIYLVLFSKTDSGFTKTSKFNTESVLKVFFYMYCSSPNKTQYKVFTVQI